jgi:hypothetical protein
LAWLGLAWLGLAWLGLAWLGLAWLGLAWLGLAWLGLAWLDHPLSTLHPAFEDGTDRGFRNVGKSQSDAGEIPKRTHTSPFISVNASANIAT